jgi:hypothetical protein
VSHNDVTHLLSTAGGFTLHHLIKRLSTLATSIPNPKTAQEAKFSDGLID